MTDPANGHPQKKTGITLKPVIQEIVRTRFYGKPIELLVERIHVVPHNSDDEESAAYRLWMSDGEKIVQAVLRSEIHPFVTSREIRDGSIVLVTRYEIKQAKRYNGKGHVLYLAIDDIEAIGHDGRESVPFTFEPVRPTAEASGPSSESTIFPGLRSSDETPPKAISTPPRDEGPLGRKRPPEEPSPSPTPTKPKARKVTFETRGKREHILFTRPKTSSGPSMRQPSGYASFSTRPKTQPSPEARRTGGGAEASSTQQDAQQSTTISRPVSLTPLAAITGPPHTVLRNRIVDVLAVIAQVSPEVVTRTHLTHLDLPPSRNLRIVDPSTAKKVQLTVFVDAERFTPEVGTVALFRSVTTHEWDGGSLKAYPRDCRGKEWFLPGPWGVEGCDVRALKHWWEARALAGL